MSQDFSKKKPFYLNKFAFTRKTAGLKDHMAKRGLKDVNIISQWDKIVGIALATYSVPEKVFFYNGKRILSIFVFETRVIEFQHQKSDILARINLVAGYHFIEDIKFTRKRKIPKTKYNTKNIRHKIPDRSHPYIDTQPHFKHDKLQKAFEKLAHSVLPIDKKKEEPPVIQDWRIAAKNLF